MKRDTSRKGRPLEIVGDFLFRKLFIFLLLGGLSSAIYGWWYGPAWIAICFIFLILVMICAVIFLLALNDRVEDLSSQFKWIVRNLTDEGLKKQFRQEFSKKEGNEENGEV